MLQTTWPSCWKMTTSGSVSTNGLSADPTAAPDNNLPMRSDFEVMLGSLLSGRARQSDRRRPFLDLALDEIRKVAWRALLRRHHIEAEILELAAHCRNVHHFRKRGIELADDLGRRSLRQEDPVPRIDIELLEALLMGGRQIRHHRGAFPRQHRDRLHGLVADRLRGGRENAAHIVDPPA